MPFENPLVAGEELIRPGIRSQDYQQGSEGWRIGRDGSAEFSDMAIRGSATTDHMNTNDLTVNGIDFEEYLSRLPQGIVAFGVTGPNTEDWGTGNNLKGPVATITFEAQPGRVYSVEVSNMQLSTLAVDNELGFQLRCTRDGTIPTATSPLLSGAEGRISYEDPKLNTLRPFGFFVQYESNPQVVKVGLFIQNYGPNNNAFTMIRHTFWQGLVYFVRDEGRANRMNQTAIALNTPTVTAPAAKTRYDKWWGHTDIQSYGGFGQPSPASGADVIAYQGNGDAVGNPGGNHYGCFYFDFNAIASALSGATILESFIYLDNSHSYLNSGVEAVIGTHSGTVPGSQIPGTKQDRWRRSVAKGGDFWTGNLGTALGNDFKSQEARGIVLGQGSLDLNHYSKWTGCAVRFIYEK